MAKQNIFDDPVFFEGYKNIRDKEGNANTLFEIPAMLALLPDLRGKDVLDLGCGFGEQCKSYAKMGAKSVTGIDISEKMLEVARRENSGPTISYLHMPIEEIYKLNGSFDVVVSSLAFHYVEAFSEVIKMVYEKMKANGVFVFSQENPLCTAYSGGARWTKDDQGNKLYVNLSNYGLEGERESRWFVDGVKKYHRMFSTIVNTLIESGFTVEKIVEPIPTAELAEKYPEQNDLFHKPDFLLVKSVKHSDQQGFGS